jgi:hypothetical protein
VNDDIPEDELKALESEVGDLLAQAEELSGELADEVGPPAATGKTAPAGPPADDLAAPRAVDAELERTDAAVSDAAREIGSTPPAPRKKISLPKKKPAGGNEATGDASPAGPQAAPTAPGGRRGNTAAPQAGKSHGGVGSLVAARVEPAPSRRADQEKANRQANPPARKLGAALANSTQVTVRALEWMDRPFHRIGYPVRVLLGWVALGLFVAAIGLYVFVVR